MIVERVYAFVAQNESLAALIVTPSHRICTLNLYIVELVLPEVGLVALDPQSDKRFCDGLGISEVAGDKDVAEVIRCRIGFVGVEEFSSD